MSCEKNIDSSIESSNNSDTNDAKERHKEGIKSVWNSYTQRILKMIPSGYALFSPRKKKGKIQQAKGAMYANKRLRFSRRRRKISSSKDQYQVTSYGMEQSKTDPCVFVKYDQNSETEVMAYRRTTY